MFYKINLFYPEISEILWSPGVGAIIRRDEKWYATNDVRYDLVGVSPNTDLVQPTLGPFKTEKEAMACYLSTRH
jgi:hypothetical protein